jgi:hypothetical protein
MKSQSIAYLLNGSEHIYWTLDLEDKVHSIWVIWTSNLQECKGNFIFLGWAEWAPVLDRDLKSLDLFCGGYPEVPDRRPGPLSTSP